ncbi:MAG: hypothetical protein VX996_01630, partial [Candidatus Thermoplasmatota archaeon]|nr:hypothetical protein [Candidatus Thermoplasmatota archaeon]
MGRRRNGRSSKKAQRRAAGLRAQAHLAGLLAAPSRHHPDVVESAAVHLVKTSRRHRLALPATVSERVCRKCWTPHLD